LPPNAPPSESPLLTLLGLARRARHAASAQELAFMAVNDTHALAPYRQAAIWLEEEGVAALSGVVQVEANVPYVQWLRRACAALLAQGGASRQVTSADLPGEEGDAWVEWLPAYGLFVPLSGVAGGVLYARDEPWTDQEVALFTEWLDTWGHAWRAKRKPALWNWRRAPAQAKEHLRLVAGRPWWKQRAVQWSAGALLVLMFPVRLTVLAPGELVPTDPAVIRAPFDGVVQSFLVKPNEAVKTGQALFTFDDASLTSRLEVARQALGTAEAEYRQATQQALGDAKYKSQLVVLAGKIEERRAEATYLQGQLERSRVVSPRDGLALFDDPSEWLGKPVVTGERILRVAPPDQVEIEGWLPIGDAIPLDAGGAATLYLNASPLSPVSAAIRYVAHDAVARPDGSYAYRVRATLHEATRHRVGLKGTVKLAGGWVPFVYWVLRRPVAAARQFIGW
jgi:hypothetical protein